MAKSIMIQGTMSNVGKSALAAGLCRVLKQDGYKVAPFKSQNMALNSFITKEGLEMGRAQVMQAEAAGIEPEAIMNPILLKPTNDTGSQVIINGKPIGVMAAREYYRHKKEYIPAIMDAYHELEKRYDIIVIEGAGSPAEINLKKDDIVNMGLAKMVDAPVLLVGDIDRGGVFAQLLGTLMLLEDDEKERVKGLVINKFRGDKTILDPGIVMLEERGGIPVVGVTPYMQVEIEDEDSLTERFNMTKGGKGAEERIGLVDIAVIRTPRISNFTDFMLLENAPGVNLRYVKNPRELRNPDMIILPGTKNTMGDLKWLRQSGMEAKILKAHAGGCVVWGICGGYQMMGQEVLDPEHVEGDIERLPGLGLLPISTRMSGEKVTRQVKFGLCSPHSPSSTLHSPFMQGYEIHMGVTTPVEGTPDSPLNLLENGSTDGYYVDSTCMGTYIHGILDNPEFIDFLLAPFADKLSGNAGAFDYHTFKEEQYDRLAEHVRRHVNLPLIYQILTKNHD